jgi:hypothetical protein
MRTGILYVAAALYAVYRLVRFHPACNQAYAAWLKLTPWTAGKPLPLGPVHPVWQDTVVLAVLGVLAAWRGQAEPWLPAVAFGLVYLGGMTLLLAATQVSTACLVLGFLWPALALPSLSAWWLGLLVLAIIAVIWWGHQKSLRMFPWRLDSASVRLSSRSPETQLQTNVPGLSNHLVTRTFTALGWPYRVLSPKVEGFSVSTLDSFFISLTLGWWFFCASLRVGIPSLPEVILMFAILAAFIRFAIYTSGLAPAFSVRGRIVTGRFIVPGFDKVLVTPLIAVAVAGLGGILIRCSGSWYPVVQCLVIGGVCFVLLSGRPTLKNWILTGEHRYRRPGQRSIRQEVRLMSYSSATSSPRA